MKAFVEPLREFSEFAEMEALLDKKNGLISVSGCTDSQKPHMMYAVNDGRKNKIICAVSYYNWTGLLS